MRNWALFLWLAMLGACGPKEELAGVDLRPGWAICCTVGGDGPRYGRLAYCRTFEVPVHHGSPGKTLTLNATLFPATGRDTQPDPVFLLAGGPGQAATEAYGPLLAALTRTGSARDLILVDQRGTGRSAPLDCPAETTLAAMFRDEDILRATRACLPELQDRDLDAFSTEASARDLETIRTELGLDAINLLGVSYGTRLALAYARLFPDQTRSLVLDGVAPTSLKLPLSFARDTENAWSTLVARCRNQSACANAFGDLDATLERWLARLDNEPATITIADPKTGAPTTLTLSRALGAQLVRGLLYATDLHALLPFTVHEAAQGNYAPLVAQAALLGQYAQESISTGLFLSVICGEDVPAIEEAALVEEAQGTFLGPSLARQILAACELWPVKPRPVDRTESPLPIPTLAISGGADPVTPPRWAETAVGAFPHHAHIVIPHAGHSNFARGCIPKLLGKFFAAPRDYVAAPDLSCAEEDPAAPFFIDPQGPPP
ncbi:MAG: alpha/beta fold hydrolase [Myxococcota bacterium]